jgi:hypothetical protein
MKDLYYKFFNWVESLFDKNKLVHYLIGSIVAQIKWILPIYLTIILATIVFVGKEFIDYKFQDKFDYKDIITAYIGFIIGLI